jgi:hypothetical protein
MLVRDDDESNKYEREREITLEETKKFEGLFFFSPVRSLKDTRKEKEKI